MNTYEKRQLYRVVIKLMLLFAVLLFIGLFIRGVFHKNPGAVEMPVESFRLDAIPDRLQVVRWNGQEIAILPRTPAILQRLGSTRENASTAALDADDSQTIIDYFVFYNRSSSGAGYPLNVVGTAASQRLTDICSKLDYDLAGKAMKIGIPDLSSPPHRVDAAQGLLIIGEQ